MRDYSILVSDTHPPKGWFCCPKGGSLRALSQSLSVTSNQTMCSTRTVAAVVARYMLYVWRARFVPKKGYRDGGSLGVRPSAGGGGVRAAGTHGGRRTRLPLLQRRRGRSDLPLRERPGGRTVLHALAGQDPRRRMGGGAARDRGTDEGAAKLRPRLR